MRVITDFSITVCIVKTVDSPGTHGIIWYSTQDRESD